MTKTNRNPIKQMFITFPHSPCDKYEFRDVLLRFEPDFYKICEEKHKDGSPHLHALVRFKNKYSKSFVLKYFAEKFPGNNKRIDVEGVRSIKNSLAYLSKEDPNPLESGPFKDNRNPPNKTVLSFVRSLGYDSIESMLELYEISKKELERVKDEIHDRYLEAMKYDAEFDWEFQKSFAKIFDGNDDIWKDDITKVMEDLGFKTGYIAGVISMIWSLPK